MPRGQPDYGAYAATTYLAGMADMAELAARLGSIDIFDRRGRVAHLDDFESTVLRWNRGAVAGGTVILDSTDPKSGSQDIKLSVFNVAGSEIYVWKGFTPLPSSRIGLEISFARPSNNAYFSAAIRRYDGTNAHWGIVRIDINGGILAIRNALGAYQNFVAGLSISTNNFIHHPIKLVVDFSTDTYARFMYGATTYDLSAYGLYVPLNATRPSVEAEFRLWHRVQSAFDIYLDDFILTQDEP